MRTSLFALALLLAVTVSAEPPTVTSIEPNVGITFAQTKVTIRGTNLAEAEGDCSGDLQPLCIARVVFVVPFFDTHVELFGTVLRVSPTEIELLAPIQAHGVVADVKVRVTGKGEAVVPRGFRWDESATSNDPKDYVRYLVPVTGQNQPGANGSIWSAEWTVRHSGDKAFPMIWNRCLPNVSPCSSNNVIPPRVAVRPPIAPRGDGTDGVFVYVPRVLNSQVGMSLRVRDVSGNASNFGAEVPVVSNAMFDAPLHLVDIPTDPHYRATLRIYAPFEYPHTVDVRVYSDSGSEIARHSVELQGIVPTEFDPVPFPAHPAYAQLDLLTPEIRAAGERVHVTIYSYIPLGGISPPLPQAIWGFISVTNNETQQVTTITP